MNWISSIQNYVPNNEQELVEKEVFLDFIENNNNVLSRNNKIGHVTVSCYIVNKKHNKVLMVYHNIYDSWSWTGGHADGEDDLINVALKEGKEETGLKNLKLLSDEIISLDILTVEGHYKNNSYVSPHLHFNLTYLFEANEEEPLVIKADENSGVKWIRMDEVKNYSSEPKMIKVYNKIHEKIREI